MLMHSTEDVHYHNGVQVAEQGNNRHLLALVSQQNATAATVPCSMPLAINKQLLSDRKIACLLVTNDTHCPRASLVTWCVTMSVHDMLLWSGPVNFVLDGRLLSITLKKPEGRHGQYLCT